MDTGVQQTKFKAFTSKLFDLPLWIKQVLYIEIKNQIEHYLADAGSKFADKDECFQLCIPKLTYIGKKELETHSKRLHPDFYKFLEGVDKNLTVIEITTNNLWSLAECSTHFVNALKLESITVPDSNIINGTAFYMSGNIRLGEYFVKLGKINLEELDNVLRTQQQIEASTGEKKGIGEILLNMGLVSKSDIEAILYIKDESNKRFYFDLNLKFHESSESVNDNLIKLQDEIVRLKKENNHLKEQIRKYFGNIK